MLADQQETEQSYQDPLTLNIADDDDEVHPEYDYINADNSGGFRGGKGGANAPPFGG